MNNIFTQSYLAKQEETQHRIIKVFLSYSGDSQKYSKAVKSYIQDYVNVSLSDYNVIFSATMFENWVPTLTKGNAEASSLSELEKAHIFISFINKKHGVYREKEINHAIKIFAEQTFSLHDGHVFFKAIPDNELDSEVIKLKTDIEGKLTHSFFKSETELIKKVSQIIIKTVYELRPPQHKEQLLSTGDQV